MITRAEVEKLGAFHAVQPQVLSLYLSIPASAAEPDRLSRRVTELIAAAEADAGPSGCLGEQDRCLALELAATAGHDWPGRTVAIVACDDVGLNEVFPLPGPQPEQAVLGVRPHIRPLLDTLQEYPAYRIAVLDGQRTWMFRAQGDEITAGPEGELGHGDQEPVVIGGRDEEVRLLLASLTPATGRPWPAASPSRPGCPGRPGCSSWPRPSSPGGPRSGPAAGRRDCRHSAGRADCRRPARLPGRRQRRRRRRADHPGQRAGPGLRVRPVRDAQPRAGKLPGLGDGTAAGSGCHRGDGGQGPGRWRRRVRDARRLGAGRGPAAPLGALDE